MPKIKGGYILLARTLTQNELWGKPPYYIKLWVWLLLKCNHKDVKNNGHSYSRGEALITLEETIENSKYKAGWRTEKISKDQAWRFYEDLREADMITTRKTTAGMFVKVNNYTIFQDSANYESNNEKSMNPTRTQQMSNTINKNEKNDKNDNKNELYTESKFSSLKDITQTIIQEIAEKYDVPTMFVEDTRLDMEVWLGKDPKKNHYLDYRLALMNWVRRKKQELVVNVKSNNFKRGGVLDATKL